MSHSKPASPHSPSSSSESPGRLTPTSSNPLPRHIRAEIIGCEDCGGHSNQHKILSECLRYRIKCVIRFVLLYGAPSFFLNSRIEGHEAYKKLISAGLSVFFPLIDDITSWILERIDTILASDLLTYFAKTTRPTSVIAATITTALVAYAMVTENEYLSFLLVTRPQLISAAEEMVSRPPIVIHQDIVKKRSRDQLGPFPLHLCAWSRDLLVRINELCHATGLDAAEITKNSNSAGMTDPCLHFWDSNAMFDIAQEPTVILR